MGPDHFRFFHALGVNLKQIYGQTEIAGISIVHRDGDVKFDTVGTPIPETEIRITEEGEILSRSPSVTAWRRFSHGSCGADDARPPGDATTAGRRPGGAGAGAGA